MEHVTDELEQLLHEAFPEAAEVRVTDRTGGGDHFLVEVTSPRFVGLSLVGCERPKSHNLNVLWTADILSLDPNEKLSPGQGENITRVSRSYPELTDG